jgi:two-component system, OmpR family, response regulator RegX3
MRHAKNRSDDFRRASANPVRGPQHGEDQVITVTAAPESPGHDARVPAETYVAVAPHTFGRLRLLRVGPVELNLDGMAVRVDGQTLHMAPKEFELLATLMQNAGKLLSRRELLDTVWGEGYPDHNKTLEVHILRLRRHLEPYAEAYARMRTVRGVGYVFDIDQ